jgi:hypothetical protein
LKPYIAEIIKHNGRTYKLPIPPKYRELLSGAAVLGLKDKGYEEYLMTVGYESLIGIKPALTENHRDIENTAESLSALTEEQVKALAAVCTAFNITKFLELDEIIKYLKDKGDKADEEA